MAHARKQSLLPEVSAETALLAYKLAYVGLILGAALVFGGTLLLFWSDSEIKRHDNVRLSTNEAETARAVADSDAAKEGAAKANTEAANANAASADANGDQGKGDQKPAHERISSEGSWRRAPSHVLRARKSLIRPIALRMFSAELA